MSIISKSAIRLNIDKYLFNIFSLKKYGGDKLFDYLNKVYRDLLDKFDFYDEDLNYLFEIDRYEKDDGPYIDYDFDNSDLQWMIDFKLKPTNKLAFYLDDLNPYFKPFLTDIRKYCVDSFIFQDNSDTWTIYTNGSVSREGYRLEFRLYCEVHERYMPQLIDKAIDADLNARGYQDGQDIRSVNDINKSLALTIAKKLAEDIVFNNISSYIKNIEKDLPRLIDSMERALNEVLRQLNEFTGG